MPDSSSISRLSRWTAGPRHHRPQRGRTMLTWTFGQRDRNSCIVGSGGPAVWLTWWTVSIRIKQINSLTSCRVTPDHCGTEEFCQRAWHHQEDVSVSWTLQNFSLSCVCSGVNVVKMHPDVCLQTSDLPPSCLINGFNSSWCRWFCFSVVGSLYLAAVMTFCVSSSCWWNLSHRYEEVLDRRRSSSSSSASLSHFSPSVLLLVLFQFSMILLVLKCFFF